MPMYCYRCINKDCNLLFSELVSYEQRETPQKCPKCPGEGHKTMEGHGINYATASLPDGTKRFDDLRQINKLRKEKAKSRAKGDLESADKIQQEIKRVNR